MPSTSLNQIHIESDNTENTFRYSNSSKNQVLTKSPGTVNQHIKDDDVILHYEIIVK